jgi:hypothetical protein
MKALAEKIMVAIGKKRSVEVAYIEHPNFWMYQ